MDTPLARAGVADQLLHRFYARWYCVDRTRCDSLVVGNYNVDGINLTIYLSPTQTPCTVFLVTLSNVTTYAMDGGNLVLNLTDGGRITFLQEDGGYNLVSLGRVYRRWAELVANDSSDRKAKLDIASEYYRQATSLNPDKALWWTEWANIDLTLSDLLQTNGNKAKADSYLAQAQDKLEHSLELDPRYDMTYFLLAQLARTQGRLDDAQKYYEQILRQNPESQSAWEGAVDMLVQTKNYTRAEELSLAFLQQNPNSLPVLRTLARNIYYPQNRLDEAIATMQRVLTLGASDPNHWDDLRVMAILLAQVGRLQEALSLAQQALQAAPQQQQKADVQSLVDQLQTQLGAKP